MHPPHPPAPPNRSQPPGSPETRAAWIVLVLSTAILVPWLVWSRFPAPQCRFFAAVGRPCPFCGSVRALRLLCRGRILEALTLQPLAVSIAIAAFLFFLQGLQHVVGFTPRPQGCPRTAIRRRTVIFATLALVLLNWLYLLLRAP